MPRKPARPQFSQAEERTAEVVRFPTPAPAVARRTGKRRKADVERWYLTPEEVLALIRAVRDIDEKHALRNEVMLSLMAAHGLRANEAATLRRTSIMADEQRLNVRRSKRGVDDVQRIDGELFRKIRRLIRESPTSPYLFPTDDGAPMTRQRVYQIVNAAGERAGFAFPVTPHMLRHAAGYRLINSGANTRQVQRWLGHRDIRSTEIYTALADGATDGFETLKPTSRRKKP